MKIPINNFQSALRVLLFLVAFCGKTSQAVEFSLPQTEGDLYAFITKLKTQSLPQLRTIERCVRETNSFVNEYLELRRLYSQKDASDKPLAIEATIIPNGRDFELNLVRNFQQLSSSNDAFFTELNLFADQKNSLQDTSNLSQIEVQIRTMQKRSAELSRKLYPISEKESNFLYIIDSSKTVLESHFKKNRPLLTALLGKECEKARVSWHILALQDDADKFFASVKKMKSYVLDLRIKRQMIVERILTAARTDLEKLWRAEFIRQGKDLVSSIDGTLAVIRLGSSFEEYWISATMNGLANSLHLKYLQYGEPLRLLTIELERLKRFEKEFLDIKDSPSELTLNFVGKSKNYQKLVQDNIDNLVKSGWKGQLDRQIFLNEKRLSIFERLSSECLQAVELHLKVARTVSDYSRFMNAETSYQSVVELCAK